MIHEATKLAMRMLGKTVKLGGDLTALVEGVHDVGETPELLVRWDHSGATSIVPARDVTWVQGEIAE